MDDDLSEFVPLTMGAPSSNERTQRRQYIHGRTNGAYRRALARVRVLEALERLELADLIELTGDADLQRVREDAEQLMNRIGPLRDEIQPRTGADNG